MIMFINLEDVLYPPRVKAAGHKTHDSVAVDYINKWTRQAALKFGEPVSIVFINDVNVKNNSEATALIETYGIHTAAHHDFALNYHDDICDQILHRMHKHKYIDKYIVISRPMLLYVEQLPYSLLIGDEGILKSHDHSVDKLLKLWEEPCLLT